MEDLANPHTFISLEPKKSLVRRFLPSGPTIPNRFMCYIHETFCKPFRVCVVCDCEPLPTATFFRETLFAIRMTLVCFILFSCLLLCPIWVDEPEWVDTTLLLRNDSSKLQLHLWRVVPGDKRAGKRTFAGSWSYQTWVWVNKHNHVTRAIVNHPFQITINGSYKPSIHTCGLSHCFTNII